jgi:hypothetical protein
MLDASARTTDKIESYSMDFFVEFVIDVQHVRHRFRKVSGDLSKTFNELVMSDVSFSDM